VREHTLGKRWCYEKQGQEDKREQEIKRAREKERKRARGQEGKRAREQESRPVVLWRARAWS
jgi:hypothetical protein